MLTLLLTLLIFIYLLLHYIAPGFFSSPLGAYLITPLLWISYAIITYLTTRYEGMNIWQYKKIRKWDFGRKPLDAVLLIAGTQIALLILFGILFTFGNSPYSHTPTALLTNTLHFLTPIIAFELIRNYIIKKTSTTTRNLTTHIVLISLFFMILMLPTGKMTTLQLDSPQDIAQFIGEIIIPLLAMNLFVTYLSYLGGATTGIVYFGIIYGFEWLSPILPNISWTLNALVQTMIPAIGFLIIQSSIQTNKTRTPRRKKNLKDPALSWTALSIVGLFFVMFSFGYFGVQPTIIYSGSMQPTMNIGDIVIIQDIDTDQIQTGDIIQYITEERYNIIHRVVDIYEEGPTKLFITQGDDNQHIDETPIVPEQIQGKAIFTIPKIGLIPIAIKSLLNIK